jgi:Mat/Ecp fimbriae periplasmic chaperone
MNLSRPHAPSRLARAALLTAAVALAAASAPASAGLMLSKVILDLGPDSAPRDDIELWNDGAERLYVVAEPSEILDPGQPTELRKPSGDPAVTGLLVTPQKLIVEPGEHKLVRVAAIADRPAHDRVYRVTIKPVAGPVTADQSALKLYVGYDVLVLYRPAQPAADLAATRSGTRLTIRNRGNTNVELAQGRQCDAGGQNCRDLPANRLYPGADWTISLPYTTPVSYRTYTGGVEGSARF